MSTRSTLSPSTTPAAAPSAASSALPVDPRRRLTWRRLRSPSAAVALACLLIAATGAALGTVVAGALAESPSSGLVWLLALCLVGSALLIASAQVLWTANSDRAEGVLREDLLDAALGQPLNVLAETAVGEILDRVDDDTHDVGALVRWQIWQLARTLFGVVPMWIVAGVTWWPAFFVFPVLGAVVWVSIRRPLSRVAPTKVLEEMAWTDHSAALEEGIAGRDDLRTSLGQGHLVQRLTSLSAIVHARFREVVRIEATVVRRAGALLHGLLAGVGVAGALLVSNGDLSVASLVTLFLVTTTFVGELNMLANQLPDLQAGMGAVLRLRQLLAVTPEPVGGASVPTDQAPALEFVSLDFSWPDAPGGFALRGVNLAVAGGRTLALVGRSGSGKSTLAAFTSRAIDPPRGTVLIGGVDVLDLDLQELRGNVGVVTQRTEILSGTLAENIALFAPGVRPAVERAVGELGLEDWVTGLPAGLETRLGAGGLKLSAGEEQLVAFARLLVRDVQVVVLDEATARMDPVTEARVVRAADRLLSGRTGILIAHRLGTIQRADDVAVLSAGRVVQHGPRLSLLEAPGHFAELVAAAGAGVTDSPGAHVGDEQESLSVGSQRRMGTPPPAAEVGTGLSLARTVWNVLKVRPGWGVVGGIGFALYALFGALGAMTGLLWGEVVEALGHGKTPVALLVGLGASLMVAPFVLSDAIWRYPRWWIEILLRVRLQVLRGQTDQRRLPPTPAGEVVARAMDADRLARYADRWVDFLTGLLLVALTAVLAGSWAAGGVLLLVLAVSAGTSALGRSWAGRSAAASSSARAGFGRVLVSVLESARTVKLAAATGHARAHLRVVDTGRVQAAVREHRAQAILDGVPRAMVQVGVVLAWAMFAGGSWGLGVTLLVANAVAGFDWFGRVAGMIVSEAPGTRAWLQETSRYAGGADLMAIPADVDLVTGDAPKLQPVTWVPLQRITLRDYTAVHDDGTIGVEKIDLTVNRGELVLLLGQVGSGKSSLLSSLAGLIPHRGSIQWNGTEVSDPEGFLRPGQVAHVAQVPRVLSGTFAENIQLGHERGFDEPVAAARMTTDVAQAGGRDGVVGHRGVRLSGGQVQRLALARALAADAELLLADDVSSALDAATELELWAALRARGSTVVGATSKRSALARADQVVVLVDGRIAAAGRWAELAPRWGHLAG